MSNSAVFDKHFVNKIGDKTAILRKYVMSTKDYVFVDIIMYYFEKERIHLKTNYIDKISLQKGLTVCKKRAVKRVQ